MAGHAILPLADMGSTLARDNVWMRRLCLSTRIRWISRSYA